MSPASSKKQKVLKNDAKASAKKAAVKSVAVKSAKSKGTDAGRVQLAARKPEKHAGKKVASGKTPAPKVAAPKSQAAKAQPNNKIVSTLKNLLGGKTPTKGTAAVKTPAKPEAKKVEAKKVETKKPEAKKEVAAAPKSAPVAQAAKGPSSRAAAAAPKAAGSAIVAKTSKPVKKAVSKAGSGLTAHGLGDSCREVACENMATTGPYCRMHYIKNWRRIKNKEKILSENRLIGFIEELVSKYPEKYIEAIRGDLASEKEFAKVIIDLDLDESSDEFEGEGGENVENIIDTIRRDFDEEGEGF